jgi:hypothetical protein
MTGKKQNLYMSVTSGLQKWPQRQQSFCPLEQVAQVQ